MASIDLKDAYYSVPICQGHTKYLKFECKGTFYKFTCLPNWLACAPRWFTKLLKPVVALLHEKDHLVSSYTDDLYLQGATYDECLQNIIETSILLEK